MLLSLLLGSYYSLYVILLRAAVSMATCASLLVSADRVMSVGKYALLRLRARLTGRLPQHSYNFKPLPADLDAYPKVSHCQSASGQSASAVEVRRPCLRACMHARMHADSQPTVCSAMTPRAVRDTGRPWIDSQGRGSGAFTRKETLAAPPPPPQVAIQLPMFNERAVCQAIIDCCCEMEWPASRLHIQVGGGRTAADGRSLRASKRDFKTSEPRVTINFVIA